MYGEDDGNKPALIVIAILFLACTYLFSQLSNQKPDIDTLDKHRDNCWKEYCGTCFYECGKRTIVDPYFCDETLGNVTKRTYTVPNEITEEMLECIGEGNG